MIADSSFVLALLNRREPDHSRILATATALVVRPWLPSPAVTEICQLLSRRVGAAGVAAFLTRLANGSAGLALLDPEPQDYLRASEIIAKYADGGLDFIDALIVALAERLGIGTILTLDYRHFRLVRPRHRAAFELLPEPV